MLTGSTGVGKFELAKAYCKIYHENDTYIVYKEDKSQSKHKFLWKKTFEDIKNKFKINKSKTDGEKLLIHQNVSDVNEFKEVFNDFKKSHSSSKMIITTRNCDENNWRGFLTLHIDTLPKQDAERLLKNHLESTVQFMDDDLECLAETLGYLPQSLQQVISYILINKISVKDCLKNLKDHSFMQKVLNHPLSEKSKFTIFKNFEMIFKTLSNKPDALYLFSVLCYLVPSKISEECLNDFPLEGRKIEIVLKALMKHSLVQKNGKFIYIHAPAKFMIFKSDKNTVYIKKASEFCTKIRQRIEMSRIGLKIAKDMIPCFGI